jgi:hypothetical protein
MGSGVKRQGRVANLEGLPLARPGHTTNSSSLQGLRQAPVADFGMVRKSVPPRQTFQPIVAAVVWSIVVQAGRPELPQPIHEGSGPEALVQGQGLADEQMEAQNLLGCQALGDPIQHHSRQVEESRHQGCGRRGGTVDGLKRASDCRNTPR